MPGVIHKILSFVIASVIFSACTVDEEIKGRESTGPMSRMSGWFENDTTLNN